MIGFKLASDCSECCAASIQSYVHVPPQLPPSQRMGVLLKLQLNPPLARVVGLLSMLGLVLLALLCLALTRALQPPVARLLVAVAGSAQVGFHGRVALMGVRQAGEEGEGAAMRGGERRASALHFAAATAETPTAVKIARSPFGGPPFVEAVVLLVLARELVTAPDSPLNEASRTSEDVSPAAPPNASTRPRIPLGRGNPPAFLAPCGF
ncbi:hypothetical protein T492DRAFT_1140650 [Pavlovales sp. CCMP2436]|nr:hypothetical protein T492DRAFT_1140650 [Pavlovales sp. CCMP2436]